jgi:hypothetical protein
VAANRIPRLAHISIPSSAIPIARDNVSREVLPSASEAVKPPY